MIDSIVRRVILYYVIYTLSAEHYVHQILSMFPSINTKTFNLGIIVFLVILAFGIFDLQGVLLKQ